MNRTTCLSRRRVLAGLAALGSTSVMLSVREWGELAAQPAQRRIDVHHHVVPPGWLAANGGGSVGEARVFKDWSVAKAVENMDRGNVATAYASITVPGKPFDNPEFARRWSRDCNEFMADLRRQHPGRFGVFALVPMPDVEATLAEIAYAYDTLHVDGIGLFTSYGSTFLGDPKFDPVFAELERRKAVIFTHPNNNACCSALQPWLSTASIEYGTDTTRAIAGYVFRGASQRYPSVRMIFSHAGGTMPALVQRFINLSDDGLKGRTPAGFLAEARKFYYDTAQVPSRGMMLALSAIIPTSRILYGTDYPYQTFEWTTGMLQNDKVFSEAELRAVAFDNAAALLGRS